MGDFHQSGEITTLHRFGSRDIAKLESEIKKLSRLRPIALVLPTIFLSWKVMRCQKFWMS